MSYNPAQIFQSKKPVGGIDINFNISLKDSFFKTSSNDMFLPAYSIWDHIFWTRTLRSAIGLQAPPPPLLSHQGHASCCAARSFFFSVLPRLQYAWGEPYLVSGGRKVSAISRPRGNCDQSGRGPSKNRPINPSLDIGCRYLDSTFTCNLDLVVRTHCYRCSFWSPVCRAGVP